MRARGWYWINVPGSWMPEGEEGDPQVGYWTGVDWYLAGDEIWHTDDELKVSVLSGPLEPPAR